MIKAIKDYAYHIVEYADSIWIPGGPDLHPAFYGEENTRSYPSWNYYREILEFSMTDAAIAMDKPILGICHGSQLVNVYYGGTLYQHVDGQSGITPELEILTYEGLLGSILEGPIRGPSYHHQAVKDLAPPLEVVAIYDGVVKATQATDGSKVMLCQFHPEYEEDKNSENILNQFIHLSSQEKILSTALSLSDVIDFGSPLGSVIESTNHKSQPASGSLFNTIIDYAMSFGFASSTIMSQLAHETNPIFCA
jgi:gamma-glutamyl-gamma-aminobutyrate hydrolase PuuD